MRKEKLEEYLETLGYLLWRVEAAAGEVGSELARIWAKLEEEQRAAGTTEGCSPSGHVYPNTERRYRENG